MNHGDFENVTIAELKEKHLSFLKQWFNDPASITMPNGESLFDLQMRAWNAIEKIIGNSKNILVVSHGMAIMTILCKIKNLELSHAREMLVNVASKTHIEFENGRGVITMFNDTGHLKDI
jgi:broad specificity phosphatase PhoE